MRDSDLGELLYQIGWCEFGVGAEDRLGCVKIEPHSGELFGCGVPVSLHRGDDASRMANRMLPKWWTLWSAKHRVAHLL
jgi:hypothetical protein